MKEKLMKYLFFFCACVSIVAVACICFFLFVNGVPAMAKIGVIDFLTGTEWRPTSEIFGIFPMIIGSIYVTGLSIVIGVPLGLLCAVYLVYYCPKKFQGALKTAVDLLAGIPSIVYGFFGLVVIVPIMQDIFGSNGQGVLTASILLGIMILPTIISVTESSLRQVPEEYYQGSLALGATHERSVFKTCIPAAKSGILAGVVLGIGRSIGETMAVMMVAGNQPVIPSSIIGGVRTMTTNIVMEMSYATGLHREALIATAVVLFVFILIINVSLSLINKKGEK